MQSPLEQFEVFLLWNSICPVAFSNVGFFVFMLIGLLHYFFLIAYKKNGYFLPQKYQYLLEQTLLFIKGLVENNIGSYYLKYFFFICSIFFIIVFSNIIGMVPYVFTLTSHLIVTFALSTLCFVSINYIGLEKHGLHFFGLFFPAGSPILLAPLLVFIEVLSYFARVFSLAIRLFANLMAGHTLLKILSNFGWVLAGSGGLGLGVFLFPIIIVFLITGLEIAIAFLQAYVFVILVCIYLNDAIHLH